MRGGGEAAERGEKRRGGRGMWEQERKEWEETEAGKERERERGWMRDRAAHCCHCFPDVLSVPPSLPLLAFSRCKKRLIGVCVLVKIKKP